MSRMRRTTRRRTSEKKIDRGKRRSREPSGKEGNPTPPRREVESSAPQLRRGRTRRAKLRNWPGGRQALGPLPRAKPTKEPRFRWLPAGGGRWVAVSDGSVTRVTGGPRVAKLGVIGSSPAPPIRRCRSDICHSPQGTRPSRRRRLAGWRLVMLVARSFRASFHTARSARHRSATPGASSGRR